MIPNPHRHYKTHQNMSFGLDGVDRVDLLEKNLTRFCGTNFYINCNSSACFEPSIIKRQNSPKCTQTQRNATTHEYWVQWCGSGAFIAKNSEATSWHELLPYFGPFCSEFCKANKRSQIHPNGTKCTKTWFWGPIEWIKWVCCEKFWRDFVARTFALVRPILHRVS